MISGFLDGQCGQFVVVYWHVAYQSNQNSVLLNVHSIYTNTNNSGPIAVAATVGPEPNQ